MRRGASCNEPYCCANTFERGLTGSFVTRCLADFVLGNDLEAANGQDSGPNDSGVDFITELQ